MDFKTINERIAYIRKSKGISQENVAEAANVSIGYISNVETGKNKLNIKMLKVYCEILNVSADYLLGFNSDYSETIYEIVDLLKIMQETKQKQVLKIVKALE